MEPLGSWNLHERVLRKRYCCALFKIMFPPCDCVGCSSTALYVAQGEEQNMLCYFSEVKEKS